MFCYTTPMASNKKQIPANVWYLSFISFFTDISSEMLYPILPIFITQTLGVPVFVLGIIEGFAEAVASLFKAIFGYWSDRVQQRKSFTFGGYVFSAVAKIIIALSFSWPVVLLGRTLDRFGKGMRTGSRDALLLEATDEENRAFIFGLHRSMDSFGAVIGSSLALLILYTTKNLRSILSLAIIPAFGALIFFFFVKDAKKKVETNKVRLSLSLNQFSPEYKAFLIAVTLFSLGNSSDTFLILRAKNLGLNLLLVISAYVLYNIIYSLASTPAGKVADKIGARNVYMLGIGIFMIVYLGFSFNTHPFFIWLLFAVYGLYIALTDGIAKALIGSFVEKEKAGTAYGVFYTFTSIATLFASIVGGILWSIISPSATFLFAVICAALAIFILSPLRIYSRKSS